MSTTHLRMRDYDKPFESDIKIIGMLKYGPQRLAAGTWVPAILRHETLLRSSNQILSGIQSRITCPQCDGIKTYGESRCGICLGQGYIYASQYFQFMEQFHANS